MKTFNSQRSISIFMKIFTASIICIIIPLIASLIYTSKSTSSTLEEEAIRHLQQTTYEKSKQTDMVFRLYMDISEMMVRNNFTYNFYKNLSETGEMDPVDYHALKDDMEKMFQNANGLYENVFFTFDGKVIIDGVGGVSEGHVFNEENEQWYFETMQTKEKLLSDYMLSPVSGRPAIVISTPILHRTTGDVLGVFATSIDIFTLTSILVEADEIESNVNTLIIDHDGLVVSSTFEELALQLNFKEADNDLADYFYLMQTDEKGYGYFTLNHEKHIGYFDKDSEKGIYIISHIPVADYMSHINVLQRSILFVMLISGVIASFIIGFLTRKVTNPIRIATEKLSVMAKGDFTQTFPANYKNSNDETASLITSIETMQENVKEIINTITQESNQTNQYSQMTNEDIQELTQAMAEVSASTSQILNSMDNIAATAEEMSSSADQLTHTVEEISSDTKAGVADSVVIGERAVELKDNVIHSQEVAEEINRDVSKKLMEALEKSKSVEQINQLSESILAITNQTNLLALNASIEAARAGEHGKGFAVVANEVRKLAEISGETVTEIQGTTATVIEAVKEMQEASEELLSFIHQTVINDYQSMVHASVQYSEDARKIGVQINNFSKHAETLMIAISENAKAINEISQGNSNIASEIDDISRRNTSVLERTDRLRNLAKETSDSSTNLQRAIEKFKIE